MLFTDSVDTVQLVSSTPTEESVQPNIIVQFTCQADSNPHPVLSLWKQNPGGYTLVEQATEAMLSFSASVPLSTEDHQVPFLCKATVDNILLDVESDYLIYRVECECDSVTAILKYPLIFQLSVLSCLWLLNVDTVTQN